MSQSTDFEQLVKNARAIYEVIGESGMTYVFFWFNDGSIEAAKRIASDINGASAKYEFGITVKEALNDCSLANFDGTTYQKGAELLRRLRAE